MGNAETPSAQPLTGVSISGDARVEIRGDLVGGDKIVGYSVEQVSVLLDQIRATFQPKPFDGRSPYVGLAAFEEQDRARFFGRERWTTDFVARLRTTRFLLIGGPSGSGKSSLVRAGLVPALKYGSLPDSENWLYAALKPGREPLEQLALAVARLARTPEAGDYLRKNANKSDSLHSSIESILSERREQRAVLLIDQFEEIFTQVTQEHERVAFLNLLTHAATVENGRAILLFTLRSDFVPNCGAYPQLNALLNRQFVQVTAMEPDELVSAIARPALDVGLQLDPDLIAQIINDMRGQPGALPLMQFTLKDLFDAQQAQGGVMALTRSDYLARGGIHKALERHADAEFANLSADEQELARAIFSSVIEIGRGAQDTRRTARFDELVLASADPAQTKLVVDKLATARLLTTDERGAHHTVTLAHEALIDAWVWLRRLVNENREAIALQNEVAQDAQEWEQHQRDASYLYTGARLATAREGLAANKLMLSGLARAFVETSIAAQDAARRRQRRVLAFVIGGLVAVVLVLAALVFFAFQAEQRAVSSEKLARSGDLTGAALSQLERDPELSLLLALEAVRTQYRLLAEDGLRQALLAAGFRKTLRGHTDALNSSVYSSDGKWILTSSSDGTARVWDAETAKPLSELRGHAGGVNDAAFSHDKTRVATAGDDKTIRIWDTATWREQFVLTNDQAIETLAFSPNDTQILTVDNGGAARLWNLETRTSQALDPVVISGVTAAAFRPDGKQIALAGGNTVVLLNENLLVEGQLPCEYADTINSLAYSPDGERVVGATFYTACVWYLNFGTSYPLLGAHTWYTTSAEFSPNGRFIVTTGRDLTVRLWDASTLEPVRVMHGHDAAVTDAEFSPDSQSIVSASADRTARLWRAEPAAELFTLGPDQDIDIQYAVYSPDNRLIISTGDEGSVHVWDAQTGKLVRELNARGAPMGKPAVSSNGKWVAAPSVDGSVQIWNYQTGELVQRLSDAEAVNAVGFSADSKFLVTAGADKLAHVWDTTTWQEVHTLRGHLNPINSAEFSPDGKQILTASTVGAARIWDVASELPLRVLKQSDGVVFATYSPDGKLIVTGSIDQTPHVWDVETGEELRALRGHTGEVTFAAFSPDGQRIITASKDDTARLWDVATGDELMVLHGNKTDLNIATYSPDGKYILTTSIDGDGRVYYARIQDLYELGKTRVTRELTCQERIRYLRATCLTPTPEATSFPTP